MGIGQFKILESPRGQGAPLMLASVLGISLTIFMAQQLLSFRTVRKDTFKKHNEVEGFFLNEISIWHAVRREVGLPGRQPLNLAEAGTIRRYNNSNVEFIPEDPAANYSQWCGATHYAGFDRGVKTCLARPVNSIIPGGSGAATSCAVQFVLNGSHGCGPWIDSPQTPIGNNTVNGGYVIDWQLFIPADAPTPMLTGNYGRDNVGGCSTVPPIPIPISIVHGGQTFNVLGRTAGPTTTFTATNITPTQNGSIYMPSNPSATPLGSPPIYYSYPFPPSITGTGTHHGGYALSFNPTTYTTPLTTESYRQKSPNPAVVGRYMSAGESGIPAAPGTINCSTHMTSENMSPLMIDLTDKPIELLSPFEGPAFDLSGTGIQWVISWPKNPSTAILAYDRNNDGKIESVHELFGNMTRANDGKKHANGFEALNTYDSNHDHQIDNQDPIFSKLSLWFDKNRNGKTDPHELKSLAQSQIKRIRLDYQEIFKSLDLHGNALKQKSTVTLKNGTIRNIFDVWLVNRGAFQARTTTREHP